MSNKLTRTAVGITAAATVLATSTAFAVAIARQEVTQPSGACVSTLPTDNVVHRSGSMRNGGTLPLYVLCGIRADANSTYGDDAAHEAGIVVANTGTMATIVQCTLYAGAPTSSTATTQGTFTQSVNVGPGAKYKFQFLATTYVPGAEFATPTFVCRLNPKVEIRYIYRKFDAEVGL